MRYMNWECERCGGELGPTDVPKLLVCMRCGVEHAVLTVAITGPIRVENPRTCVQLAEIPEQDVSIEEKENKAKHCDSKGNL